MSSQQIDRVEVAGRGVLEGLTGDLDAALIDDADGEGVLVRVDAPD